MMLTLKMLSFPVFNKLAAFTTRNLGGFCCWSFLLPRESSFTAVLLLLDAKEDVVSVLVPKELVFVFDVIIIVSIGEKNEGKTKLFAS